MAEKRWITGEEILDRWDTYLFELVQVVLSGDLVPVDVFTGERLSRENNGCFFCEKNLDEKTVFVDYDSYTVCFSEKVPSNFDPEIFVDKDYYCSCHDVHPNAVSNLSRLCLRREKTKESCFVLKEVEAYEQAHGLGPLPHKPETAEALAETLRAAGITDAGMIARMVKAAFPDTKQYKIGLLLEDGDDKKKLTPGAYIKRAQRAEEKKDAPAPAKRTKRAKAK